MILGGETLFKMHSLLAKKCFNCHFEENSVLKLLKAIVH